MEFFTAEIRNRNTRLAYARAVAPFLDWCDDRGLTLERIEPIMVAAYIEQLATTPSRNPRVKNREFLSKPTIKQNLAAIRRLFDYLVTGGTEERTFGKGGRLETRKWSELLSRSGIEIDAVGWGEWQGEADYFAAIAAGRHHPALKRSQSGNFRL